MTCYVTGREFMLLVCSPPVPHFPPHLHPSISWLSVCMWVMASRGEEGGGAFLPLWKKMCKELVNTKGSGPSSNWCTQVPHICGCVTNIQKIRPCVYCSGCYNKEEREYGHVIQRILFKKNCTCILFGCFAFPTWLGKTTWLAGVPCLASLEWCNRSVLWYPYTDRWLCI
jgi:hypothetical protein